MGLSTHRGFSGKAGVEPTRYASRKEDSTNSGIFRGLLRKSLKENTWISSLLAAGSLAIMAHPAEAQTSLNVTNFGAVGDATNLFVNTVSNSVVVTTINQVPNSAIGDAIEVFKAGPATYGIDSYGNNTNGNQDLVATITNITMGTNLYVSQIPQANLTGTFATYGHNNRTNFMNAIAASGTNTTINIPTGNWLLLPFYSNTVFGVSIGLKINRGGLTFKGAGTNNTTLLSQGAWTLQDGNAMRGFMFVVAVPITNDYPFTIQDMTLDGGVQQGSTDYHGFPASVVDGRGWDETHGALVIAEFAQGHTITFSTLTNVVVDHWRGEMTKSVDGSTNGSIAILNCVFNDGNATAINLSTLSLTPVSGCVFNNLDEVAEYYQYYSIFPSYFQNNLVTNILQNLFAINGGKLNNPPFIIQNNRWYGNGQGWNGIATTPGDNILIRSNFFACVGPTSFQMIAFGTAGYQSPANADNSNIVVSCNVFSNVTTAVIVEGCCGNQVEGLVVSNNVGFNVGTFGTSYGYSTNVLFTGNVSSGIGLGNGGTFMGQWFFDSLSDQFSHYRNSDFVGVNNTISYANGARQQIFGKANSVYLIDDTQPAKIPPGAQMVIENVSLIPSKIPVYLDAAMTKGPITMSYGQSLPVQWTNNAWVTAPSPPVPLRVSQ